MLTALASFQLSLSQHGCLRQLFQVVGATSPRNDQWV